MNNRALNDTSLCRMLATEISRRSRQDSIDLERFETAVNKLKTEDKEQSLFKLEPPGYNVLRCDKCQNDVFNYWIYDFTKLRENKIYCLSCGYLKREKILMTHNHDKVSNLRLLIQN